MKFVKKIPPADRELSLLLMSQGWKKLKEPSNFYLAILSSVPLMALNGIITYFVIKPFYDPLKEIIKSDSISFEINILVLLAYLVIIFLLLVFHELLHAMFIPHFIKSNKIYWGLSINGGFVSTTQKLSRANFMVISIAPYMLMSIIMPLIIGMLGIMNGFIFFLAIFNAMASSVDVLNLILISLQTRPKSFIINNGFETYYSEAG